ncbi:MAG: alpha-1,4-glucan--maltose-1-phosphate maltosyltransferase [Polyangiaceae bacterium]|nr:alpha-1,4-glucan--maltose-1-phosphate maltosyltransferase [Polyangiaceae bacterium]
MTVLSLPRLMIEDIRPSVDGGLYALKRIVGDKIHFSAAIYKDGHDALDARVVIRDGRGEVVVQQPMCFDMSADRWFATVEVLRAGTYQMTIEAWPDHFGTWRRDLQKRLDAGQDLAPELLEGAAIIRRRLEEAPQDLQQPMKNAAAALSKTDDSVENRLHLAFSQTLLELMQGPLVAADQLTSRNHPLRIDRREAAFASWYEAFPRSQGRQPGQHGTLKDTEARIPEVAAMGFDVLYLPPIHPIGLTHRKGRNNSTTAEPGDVGSPWAIGGHAGGHTAIHPELGDVDDFKSLVKTAGDFGIEIALDIAFQCSPDHPWVKSHPEWFFVRPDGSIRYAENPPKRYEDIYPLNFWGDEGLWIAARDAMLYWVELGVKTFRVDNPHTKPLAFWEWAIREIQEKHPDVIFLSESFTKPNRMYGLAKIGFTQSYTYFTWKNTRQELEEFLTELSSEKVADFYRPNFFANTPDILHEYLQKGGRAAFRIRLLLAATLAPVYGIYSGFELCEGEAVAEGSEEYLNSEKYEIRVRDWNAPGNIKRDVSRLNRLRQVEPALQELTNFRVVHGHNDRIFSYLKLDGTSEQPRHLLGVVNLDPHEIQETSIFVPLADLGLGENDEYTVEDLLSGSVYTWRGSENYVRLDPREKVGHLFRIQRK